MPVNLAYKAYQLFWEALDYLYPPNCGGCGVSGVRWCEECARNTTEIMPPLCPICGNPNSDDEPCKRCQVTVPYYTSLRSCTVFSGPIREAIHKFKYKGDVGLGEVFSRMMISSLRKLNWSLDIVVSVPLGLVRFKERGYNQATLLARPVALALRVPYLPDVVSRVRETRTQVGLSVTERHQNMVDAFRAKNIRVRGKIILLVDDVATSGATIDTCAKALLEVGAKKVYGFSLARAIFSPDGKVDIT